MRREERNELDGRCNPQEVVEEEGAKVTITFSNNSS
jgi:hypothetical protein